MKQFKLLRGESSLSEYYDDTLTVDTTNHIAMFGTASLPDEERLSNTLYYHPTIGSNNERIFINDTRIQYKLTLWNRLKTWWKYSMSREEKINFCLLIALLFSIFSMLGYITYAHGVITEQVSKLK